MFRDDFVWGVASSAYQIEGRDPQDGLAQFKGYLPGITDGDMALIAKPLDFMGQNIYNGYMVRAGAECGLSDPETYRERLRLLVSENYGGKW